MKKINPTFLFQLFSSISIVILLLTACSSSRPTKDIEFSQIQEDNTLTIMTHDSFAVSEEIVQTFENQHNVNLRFQKSGDTGTALNKAILSKGNPIADIFYGVDNTFLSRALEEEIFDKYDSPVLASIDEGFLLDPQNRALPVDYGDVCLNYDELYFSDQKIIPPDSLEDLLKPEFSGLLVVQNPATSSPGLAFLLTTIGKFGEEGYLDYWQGLVANEVLIVNDWETAYYSEFSGSAGRGPRPIVVSYNSSPAFEVIYSETPIDKPSTSAVVSDGSCFRQIEFVGILKGTDNRKIAEQWIDYMLSPTFQEDMPEQMFVFPVNSNAVLDQTFLKFLDIPQQTAQVNPEEIARNREKWIKDWTETILR